MIQRIEPGWTHVRDALSKQERRVRRQPGLRRREDREEAEAEQERPAEGEKRQLDVVA